MDENFQQQLNKTIALSQKILLAMSNELKSIENNDNTIEKDGKSNQLIELNIERDELIKLVFNEQQAKHYTQHLDSINQIVELDHQLIKYAEKNKLALKASLLKMKKNQKAADSYKKY